jgi:large subunit ribosomal protein L23
MKTNTNRNSINKKISQERLCNILLAPLVSEKSTRLTESKQVVFKVSKEATKNEIKQAVESLFEVKVTAVNVANTHAKARNFKQRLGHRKAIKKAYVTLDKDSEIKLIGEE